MAALQLSISSSVLLLLSLSLQPILRHRQITPGLELPVVHLQLVRVCFYSTLLHPCSYKASCRSPVSLINSSPYNRPCLSASFLPPDSLYSIFYSSLFPKHDIFKDLIWTCSLWSMISLTLNWFPRFFLYRPALLRHCVAFTRYNFVPLFFFSFFLSIYISLSISLHYFFCASKVHLFLNFSVILSKIMLSLLFFGRHADFCSAPLFPSPFVNALAPNHPISWRKTFLTLTMSILSFFSQLSLSATVVAPRFRLRQSFFSCFLLNPERILLLRFWNRGSLSTLNGPLRCLWLPWEVPGWGPVCQGTRRFLQTQISW